MKLRLTPSRRAELAQVLRDIARMYDTRRKPRRPFNSGICWAVHECSSFDGYSTINAVLLQVEQSWGVDGSGYLAWFGVWEARVNMCLLMAHWLEDNPK